jgi:hypothetical protein
MVTSRAAGEPVAGSCCGATAGPCAGAADAGASWVGSTDGCVGGAIDARGVDDEVETNAVVELDELLEPDGALDEELLLELGGTLELELELGGTLEELDELGGTLDEELLDVQGSLDDVLEGALEELVVFTIEVLEVWVADAGPLSTADAPSSTPIPSSIHPALADRSMTHLPLLVRRPRGGTYAGEMTMSPKNAPRVTKWAGLPT